jgi:hypothetical protein
MSELKKMTENEKTIFNERLDKLDKNVQRVLYILESDSRTNNKGLVETVQETKNDVHLLKSSNATLKTQIAMYGTIGGAAITFLIWLGKTLLIK